MADLVGLHSLEELVVVEGGDVEAGAGSGGG